jgi:hypothetical protein
MAEGVMIEFYTEVFEDEAASQKAGKYVGKEVEMVRKTMGMNSASEDRASDSDRDRWSKEYEAFKKGEEAPVDGSPIAECPLFSKLQSEELKREGILTLEDLLAVPDNRLPGPGMKTLRDKARAFLDAAQDKGVIAAEVAKLRKENESLMAKMEDLTEQINSLAQKKGKVKAA